jgi:hypothetical protein
VQKPSAHGACNLIRLSLIRLAPRSVQVRGGSLALADFTSETMADWDAQAADLLSEGIQLKARGAAVLQKHRDKREEAHAGFTKMEEAVRQLEGDNGAPKGREAKDSAG